MSIAAKVYVHATKALGHLDPVIVHEGEFVALQVRVAKYDEDGKRVVVPTNAEVHLKDGHLVVVHEGPVDVYNYDEWLGVED